MNGPSPTLGVGGSPLSADSSVVALAVLLAPALFAGSLHAQDASREIVIRGSVIDAVTLEPLDNAFVVHELTSIGELTDANGAFLLELPAGEPLVVSIGRFGYEDMRFELPDSAVGKPLVLPMNPAPVMLEGLGIEVNRLTVVEGRLESRRRRYSGAARTLVGDQILGVGTAYDLVRRRTGGTFPCVDDPIDLCTRDRQGRDRRILICVDEQPAWGGILMLESLGIDDVYALEVFDIRVSQIRLYTRYFMLRNLTKDVPFRRIEDGC